MNANCDNCEYCRLLFQVVVGTAFGWLAYQAPGWVWLVVLFIGGLVAIVKSAAHCVREGLAAGRNLKERRQ